MGRPGWGPRGLVPLAEESRGFFSQRQPDAKGCPLPHVALQLDAPTVIAHDALHNHQAQAAAFFLRGVERFKDAVDCLTRRATIAAVSTTSFLHLKQQISQLSEKERVEITAYLHRLKQQTPAWKKEMTRRMEEMNRGVKFKLSSRVARPRHAAA
jgi:hypothetical protein